MSQHPRSNLPSKDAWRNFTYLATIPQSARWPWDLIKLDQALIDLAGLAWQATESADTRAWGLLPDRIQVLRIELPAGEHEVTLRPVNAAGTALGRPAAQRVRIADGRNTYLLGTFPDTQLVGKLLVSQPQ